MTRTIKQTTAPLPAAQRFEYWQDAILPTVQLDLRTPREDFSCERLVTPGSRGTTIDTRSTPFGVERHRRQINRDGFDTIVLCTLLSGEAAQTQGGRHAAIRPGDLFVCDSGRPYEVGALVPYREARLSINRSFIGSRLGDLDDLAGLIVPRETPLGHLFTGYLAGYIEAAPTMTSAECEAGLGGLLHLFATLIAQVRPVRVADGESLKASEVRSIADAFIAKHLTDSGLDVQAIVKGLGISRTRLYNAFTERGGVQAAIRDARLDWMRDRIAATDASIEALASAARFNDYASFSRAFRRRFGASPREMRFGMPPLPRDAAGRRPVTLNDSDDVRSVGTAPPPARASAPATRRRSRDV